MLLKSGLACGLKDEEECENIVISLERVVSDLIGLTTAVAKALNNALKSADYDENPDMDKELIKKWCQFYSEELLPKTKGMVKSTAPTLDAYGLFLPSRMGASVSQDLLKKGLEGADADVSSDKIAEQPQEDEEVCHEDEEQQEERVSDAKEDEERVDVDENSHEDVYDEYEYDEYEYDEY